MHSTCMQCPCGDGVVRRNPGSDGAEESPSSDVQLTDENTPDDETWNETWLRDGSDSSTAGDVTMLRDPPNYYEAVQYLQQVFHSYHIDVINVFFTFFIHITFFTATCFSNVAVMGSLDVRPSVCPSVCL